MIDLLPILFPSSVLVSDSFNDSDNATTLGNTDTGQAWTNIGGNFGIINNQAYAAVVSTPTRAVVPLPLVERIPLSIECDFPVYSGARLLNRYQDTLNEIYLSVPSDGYTLSRRQGGTITEIGRFTVTPQNSDKVMILDALQTIFVYLNGALILTVNESFLNTSLKVGFASSVGTTRFDNFVVRTV